MPLVEEVAGGWLRIGCKTPDSRQPRAGGALEAAARAFSSALEHGRGRSTSWARVLLMRGSARPAGGEGRSRWPYDIGAGE